jgi:3-oxoadipate enol-lactonase
VPVGRVGELDIYYERRGDGPPLLLIGGSGQQLAGQNGRGSAALAPWFDVVEYDQRGLGQTVSPNRDYTMAEYAADAVGLMDLLGWVRPHVVGVSFGGMVAQELAVTHPDRIGRLVLACTSPGGAGGSSWDLRELDGLPADERLRASATHLDLRCDFSTDPPTYAPGVELVFSMHAGAFAAAPDPAKAVGLRRQLDARAHHDVWDRLHRVTAPTLAIGGRYDGQAPMANMEAIASRVADCRLVMCEGGHLFMLQDPSAWPTILAFLRE